MSSRTPGLRPLFGPGGVLVRPDHPPVHKVQRPVQPPGRVALGLERRRNLALDSAGRHRRNWWPAVCQEPSRSGSAHCSSVSSCRLTIRQGSGPFAGTPWCPILHPSRTSEFKRPYACLGSRPRVDLLLGEGTRTIEPHVGSSTAILPREAPPAVQEDPKTRAPHSVCHRCMARNWGDKGPRRRRSSPESRSISQAPPLVD